MGKALKLRYSTEEGKRLFHLCIRLDKAIRQLRTKMFLGSFQRVRFLRILRDLEIHIDEYAKFIDSAYAVFQPDSNSTELSSLPTQNYSKILKSISQVGSPCKVIVSVEPLIRLFITIKRTDVCIRIAEEFGLHQYEAYTHFRNNFKQQISKLEDYQSAVSSTASSIIQNFKNKKKINR